ncbi:4F2 cell-surface antigen heavy chain isoform X4 [Callorhinchus milii]|uniref:4F2 cell-surface antigen heavy chain isoform X4 n=1 Tax=Callorhinchus milii TaxID=7868 RepID=UPI001C3F520F|nr:4F2 cell-surface antigen heavy chain isoform X4 [Callorhinchus milii]
MKKLIGKRKSVEGKTMEGQRVEGETVEGKTMEGQRVEGEKVEGKLMKKLIGKRKSVEGKPVEGQRVGRQKAKRKWMKRLMGKRKSAKEKAMEGQRVGGETVEGQRVEGETVEGQRVEGETVEGKPVEGQRVGRQKAKRKWMKRLIGKRKSAKEKAMERQRVGGETVEGKTMEGQRVEGQKAKGKTVRSQREEGGKAEGETTGGESVKGRTKGGERKTGDAASPETKPETEAESLEAKAKPEDRWHSAQSLNASLGSTLSRVELMVASGSDWVWARRLMASLFWLSWISLVSGALLVIVRSPECNPPPRLHWWYDGPMYQITPRSFQDSDGDGNGDLSGIKHQLHHIKMLHMRAIIIGPIHQYKPDDRNKTNLKSIDMIYGNIQNFRYLIKSANTRGLKVLIDLTPNPLGTKLNKWFNTTFDFEEQNKILADFQFWLRTGVDGIFISLSTDDIETSMFGNPYKGHIVSLVSENLGKLIALIMFTLPGTPIIYYGDEIGLEDYQKSPSPLMRWNNSKHDGFTVGSPWIKPDLKLCRNNTMQQSDDPLSLLSFYKQLGFFKKELESLKYGSFRKVLNETTYFAYTRQWNAHGILAVLNFGDTIHVDFTASGLPLTSLLILSSSLGLQCQIVNMKNLAIPSLEAYMLKYYVLD